MSELALNKFEYIEHKPLRDYNRAVYLSNLLSDAGYVAAQQYVDMFTQEERQRMYLVGMYIKAAGPKAAKEYATKGLEFEDVSGQY